VHIKDVIWILIDRVHSGDASMAQDFHIRSFVREVLIVPESKAATELLAEFRSRRTGLAMVVDEFGSILGLVTLEDILEQMVGEIHDEFDVVERPLTLPDGGIIFDAGIKVRDLETQYKIALADDSSYETIGGFVLSRLGFIPHGGESFEADGYRFTVMEMERRRISRVKIKALPPPAPPPESSPEPATAATTAPAVPAEPPHEKLVPAGPARRSRRK
jgi:putative hemolysin